MNENENQNVEQITFDTREPIKGFPELRWTGKRPYTSTQYFPAQLKEVYGQGVEHKGKDWLNKIFWGDNLQVMSHLLKEYRGKVDLIYIDPPFDSKADYKKKIQVRGKNVTNDSTSFEEKQYGDIWTNDEYLQFMYERLIIMRELLADTGSIYLHCDYKKSAHLRLILDEVFGQGSLRNEIIWYYEKWTSPSNKGFQKNHDNIFFVAKNQNTFNIIKEVTDNLKEKYEKGYLIGGGYGAKGLVVYDAKVPKVKELISTGEYTIHYADPDGKAISDVWKIPFINPQANERLDYPTQKPEALIERIIKASSNPNDLVFDCFMGSGTTQAVAMKLGRRFIGADINLGAIQTTTKRLLNVANDLNTPKTKKPDETENTQTTYYTGFEVYNVNNYDFFRNPLEAKKLLTEALEIQPFPDSHVFDGEKDGRMVYITPVNRIATKADLESLKENMPWSEYEKRKEQNPNKPAERITIVCMGHEPDIKQTLLEERGNDFFDIQVVDILRDKTDLQLKRESEADVAIEGGNLVVRQFFPMNLLQKLSVDKESVEDWTQLVESIMIDWNYDGVVMQPSVTDVPSKNELVKGVYEIPDDHGTIKIKITDLLAESWEGVMNG